MSNNREVPTFLVFVSPVGALVHGKSEQTPQESALRRAANLRSINLIVVLRKNSDSVGLRIARLLAVQQVDHHLAECQDLRKDHLGLRCLSGTSRGDDFEFPAKGRALT